MAANMATKWRVVRWLIMLPLFFILLSSTYQSVKDYLASPIATTNSVEVAKNYFYPGVTICPFGNPEVEKSLGFTKNVTTFAEAMQQSLKPGIHSSRYYFK